ncbi:hypothetical protein [Nocardiopsis coralliicola]
MSGLLGEVAGLLDGHRVPVRLLHGDGGHGTMLAVADAAVLVVPDPPMVRLVQHGHTHYVPVTGAGAAESVTADVLGLLRQAAPAEQR